MPYVVRIACGLNGKIRREGYILTPSDVEDAKRLPPGIIEFIADETPQKEVAEPQPTPDFEAMTLEQLREYARAHGIDVPARANRKMLLKRVRRHE